MDSLLTSINFEQLGITGVFLAYLIWTNRELRQENSQLRKESRQDRADSVVQLESFLAAISELRQTLVVIQERLKP